jgi:hypothetical protein
VHVVPIKYTIESCFIFLCMLMCCALRIGILDDDDSGCILCTVPYFPCYLVVYL